VGWWVSLFEANSRAIKRVERLKVKVVKKLEGQGKTFFTHNVRTETFTRPRLVSRSGCRGSIRCSVAAAGEWEGISPARTVWRRRLCPRCHLSLDICLWKLHNKFFTYSPWTRLRAPQWIKYWVTVRILPKAVKPNRPPSLVSAFWRTAALRPCHPHYTATDSPAPPRIRRPPVTI
jgi:hypothetical protein